MILGLPDEDTLRAIVNLETNVSFTRVKEWLSGTLAKSGDYISAAPDTFSLTKCAGAVSLLVELNEVLSEARRLQKLAPIKQQGGEDE